MIPGMPPFLDERGGIHTQLHPCSAAHLGVVDDHALVHGQPLRCQRVPGRGHAFEMDLDHMPERFTHLGMAKAVDFFELSQPVNHLEQAVLVGLIVKFLRVYFDEYPADGLHPLMARPHHRPRDRQIVPERIGRPQPRHRRLDALANLFHGCKGIKKMRAQRKPWFRLLLTDGVGGQHHQLGPLIGDMAQFLDQFPLEHLLA
ncbi:hypothetical protein FLG15_05745 [Xanthomonas phaseoli pv. dieffenbachiae]